MAPGHVPDSEPPPCLGGGVAVKERSSDDRAELVLGVMAHHGGPAEPELEPRPAGAQAEVDVFPDVAICGIEAADGVEGGALHHQVRRRRPSLLDRRLLVEAPERLESLYEVRRRPRLDLHGTGNERRPAAAREQCAQPLRRGRAVRVDEREQIRA